MMKGVYLSFTLVPMHMDPFTHILGTQTAQKKAFSRPFLTDFETEVRHLRNPCWSPRSSFSLKICVIVLHTHRYHAPKFQPNTKHHNGVLIFPHFARAAACLLLACCLLATAAKPGRSTLDTKKGYKTKTGFTSSVTLVLTPTLALALALTRIEYWDRAGGGRSIV